MLTGRSSRARRPSCTRLPLQALQPERLRAFAGSVAPLLSAAPGSSLVSAAGLELHYSACVQAWLGSAPRLEPPRQLVPEQQREQQQRQQPDEGAGSSKENIQPPEWGAANTLGGQGAYAPALRAPLAPAIAPRQWEAGSAEQQQRPAPGKRLVSRSPRVAKRASLNSGGEMARAASRPGFDRRSFWAARSRGPPQSAALHTRAETALPKAGARASTSQPCGITSDDLFAAGSEGAGVAEPAIHSCPPDLGLVGSESETVLALDAAGSQLAGAFEQQHAQQQQQQQQHETQQQQQQQHKAAQQLLPQQHEAAQQQLPQQHATPQQQTWQQQKPAARLQHAADAPTTVAAAAAATAEAAAAAAATAVERRRRLAVATDTPSFSLTDFILGRTEDILSKLSSATRGAALGSW